LSGREAQWTLEDLEAIVKKAVREAVEQARSEEMKLVADAMNKLATYTFKGFKKILEALEEHSKILKEHSKILKSLKRGLLS
jgi:replication-associated recombination protein RarA